MKAEAFRRFHAGSLRLMHALLIGKLLARGSFDSAQLS
jgi:hypothetical protein